MIGRTITALSLILSLLIINVHSAQSSDELLFLTNDFPLYAFIDQQRVSIAFLDMEVEMYIGTSLNVPDETVAAWQTNLDKMKKTGAYQALLSNNRYQWKLP